MGTVTNRVEWRPGRTSTTYHCSGTTFAPSNATFPFLAVNTITKGENFPDWRYRLAHGMQCTTLMSGVQYSRKSGVALGSAKAKLTVPGATCVTLPYVSGQSVILYGANLAIGPVVNNTSLSSADNLAKTRFVQKLREVQTTFQGGVFLGELNETLRMLSSPAKSLRKGLVSYLGTLKKRRRQVKRVSPRKRLSAARRVIADTYLEYAFGWRPLIHDIDDAMKTLANSRFTSEEKWRPVNASGKDEVYSTSFSEVLSTGLISSIKVRVEEYAKKEVTYRGCVSVEHPSNSFGTHSGNFLEDFVPTVWELIPYSFLVDYFTNIGDIISAATYLRSHVRWMARTEVDFTSSEAKDTLVTPNSSTTLSIEAKCQRVQEFRSRKAFSRAPYTGSLVPSLEFTIPGFGTKWVNMGALLAAQRALVPFHR
jgi:hypothetical protein